MSYDSEPEILDGESAAETTVALETSEFDADGELEDDAESTASPYKRYY